MKLVDRAVGCLLGSAYGDSLGAAVEFMSIDEIRSNFGAQGICSLAPFLGFSAGSITDDTQMAIATAEGIIAVREKKNDVEKVIFSIWESYRAWLRTQNDPQQARLPGNTCISALRSGRMGTIERPLNYSAGCGAIMRAHPIGITYSDDPEKAFLIGALSGVITHGNPDGYLPAGFLAMLIAFLLNEGALQGAISKTLQYLTSRTFSVGTSNAVKRAFLLSNTVPNPEFIDETVGGGGGWRGHDALAIALYSALQKPDDPISAVRIAVNHSGDSDSTGAIAGSIMGAIHGKEQFAEQLGREKIVLEHEEKLYSLAQSLLDREEYDEKS